MKNSIALPAHETAEKNKKFFKPAAPWQRYWSESFGWSYPDLMKLNADICYTKIKSYMDFSGRDRVLNIGCGPGFLETRLAPHVESICAADISESFLKICEEQNRHHLNVRQVLLSENYTDLTVCGEGYTKILCVSVVQYYRSYDEVEALIASARSLAAPGAKMLIVDWLVSGSGWVWLRNGCLSIAKALNEGYSGILAAHLIKRWPSLLEYQLRVRRNSKLLFSAPRFKEMSRRLGVRIKSFNADFSIETNRRSLLVEFD